MNNFPLVIYLQQGLSMLKYNQNFFFSRLQIPLSMSVCNNKPIRSVSFLLRSTATGSHLIPPTSTVYLRSATTPTPCHHHPRRARRRLQIVPPRPLPRRPRERERTSTHRTLIAGSSLLKTAKHKVVYPWGGSRLGGKVAGTRAQTSRSGRDAIPHVASC